MRRFLSTILCISLAVPCAAAKSFGEAGLGVSAEELDTTVRPQDDFYAFVNGGWLKKTLDESD